MRMQQNVIVEHEHLLLTTALSAAACLNISRTHNTKIYIMKTHCNTITIPLAHTTQHITITHAHTTQHHHLFTLYTTPSLSHAQCNGHHRHASECNCCGRQLQQHQQTNAALHAQPNCGMCWGLRVGGGRGARRLNKTHTHTCGLLH